MIKLENYENIAKESYKVIEKYVNEWIPCHRPEGYDPGPFALVGTDEDQRPQLQNAWDVAKSTNRRIKPALKLKSLGAETKGYASWLMRLWDGYAGILLQQGQINEWADNDSVIRNTIEQRAIYHEIGHVILHGPDLLDNSDIFAATATEDQENEAWIFALCCVSLVVGNYAKWTRQNYKQDWAPRVI